jgi:hypothetical protein
MGAANPVARRERWAAVEAIRIDFLINPQIKL